MKKDGQNMYKVDYARHLLLILFKVEKIERLMEE